MTRPVRLVTAAVTCCLLLAACDTGSSTGSTAGSSTTGKLLAGASYFQGLPPSVVAEVLANPTQKLNFLGMSGKPEQSLAQAAVRNMIFCREELHVYQWWVTKGQAPEFTSGPRPAHPLQPGSTAIAQDYAGLRAVVAAGDLRRLKSELTSSGGCGQWVPATPDDVAGPTIAQVVSGQHA
jgi:hypothetical protein